MSSLMQGQGGTIDSFPEIVNIEEGMHPNNTSTGQPNSLHNMLNPVETRISNYIVPSGGTMHGNAIALDVQSISDWNYGEPSSRLGLQNQVMQDTLNHQLDDDGRKMEWGSSSYDACCQAAPRSEDRWIEQPHVGSSSGSSHYMGEENTDGSGSSLGSWGLSCKRKALEGTSGQSAGTSSCFQQIENAACNAGPACHEASSSLNLSTPSSNFLNVISSDQSNPRVGLGMRVVSDAITSSGQRRANPGNQQESLPSSLLSTRAAGRSSLVSPSHPRVTPFNESLDLRPTAAIEGSSGFPSTQPHMRTTSIVPRNVHSIPWNSTSNSRAGIASSSVNFGERAVALQEEPNIRNIPRNNVEHPIFVPETEMRNVAQDPMGRSLVSGNPNTSGSIPSSNDRSGFSSSIHPLPGPAWIRPHNPPIRNTLRLSDFVSRSPIDSESGGHSNHSPFPSSSPSTSSQEPVVPSESSSQGNNQPYPRLAFILERHGDDVLGMAHSLRALAADIEGRHRLISEIRQTLNAIRRGEDLRLEDYMPFGPFIHHGMGEMHDRHGDMRLDVDNMSYEELLELEERIGDVSTGLSEENILKLMKQQKHSSSSTESDLEPCSICREEYADGDDTGILDCGHDFHTNCIKQWLMLKNLCPICKTAGLLK
ncbi:hypothetical protein V6N11_010531 [Hibiscus sabdariffa]|uniref:RING-type E3 ubiquitin transferase n=1 Tax=Hibiscus sabdariffa TaxID=183260 RepID=A0ABR2S5J2_9ROSI